MEHLLLNVFILLMGIFIYYLVLFNKKFEQKNRKLIIFSICTIGIIVCMTFPFYDGNGHIYDLRLIPFVIGALYGGRKVAIALFLVILLYSLIIVNPGFNIPLFQSFMFLLVTLYTNIKFPMQILKKKLLITFVIMTGMTIATVMFHVIFLRDMLDSYRFAVLPNYSLMLIITTSVIVYIIEFILQNKKIEEEINGAQKLRVISELAASVSHEVRNPLTVTRGFIQLLNDPNIDKQKKREFLDLSIQELDRAQAIISEYLAFAKPPEKSDFTLLNVKDELSYIIQVMTPSAEMQKITIIHEGLRECFIKGDKKKFCQCVINLIKNSIEATVNGGVITISANSVKDEVIISIKDSGVGMTHEQLIKLGTPYFTTKEKGTGLGTGVVFTIVRAMDGRVEVESEENKGTTFTLIFPYQPNKKKLF